jgi:long-chain acyl-CoA synthetase
LSREIEEFFYACGILVCQGYGLTETAPMVSCNAPGQFEFGTVGRPIKGCEVRIGPDGEIQVRGDNVMLGYYNRPNDTAATIVDGWFHTGDVGLLDEDGYLKVTDRIKDLIITSQGKNIAPQRVENLIAADAYIQQVVAIGDQRKYLTALIEPSFPDLERYAHQHEIAFTSREDLVLNPTIVDFYRQRIDDASFDLAPYEKVRKFALLPQELTEDSGAMTPTLKVKRRVVESQYEHLISAMYDA